MFTKEDFLTCYGDVLVQFYKLEDEVAFYVARLEDGTSLGVSVPIQGKVLERVGTISELDPDAGCAISPDHSTVNLFN